MTIRLMIRIVFILTLLLIPFGASASWKAVPSAGDQTVDLMIVQRGDQDYVALKTFCRTFKCKFVYQWASHRVVIQNPLKKSGAIVSSRRAAKSPTSRRKAARANRTAIVATTRFTSPLPPPSR